MAVKVDPSLSPRIVTVPISDGNQISMQDLGDESKEWAQLIQNLSYRSLITTTGKQDLGGGVLVGITNQFEDAVLAFEQRPISNANGVCTTLDTNGQILEDTGADFVSAGVNRGAYIINLTDQSVSTVYRRISGTQLQMYPLDDGTNNQWNVNDVYKIWQPTECEASGGNLVAVDAVGDQIAGFMPTWGTFVVRTSSASATIAEQTSIQQASFNNRVLVDGLNGTTSIVFPAGTGEAPVKDIATAQQILTARGLSIVEFIGDFTFDAADVSTNLIFVGQSLTLTEATLPEGSTFINCEFQNMSISGYLDGESTIRHCNIGTLSYVNGIIENCALNETITIDTTNEVNIINCYSGVAGQATPILDMAGLGNNLVVRGYSGGLKLINHTEPSNVASIDLTSGQIIIDSTISAGTFTVRGIGKLIDNSTGTAVIVPELLDSVHLNDSVYNGQVTYNSTTGVAGTNYPAGTIFQPTNNWTDALSIASTRGITDFLISSNTTLDSTINVGGLSFRGTGIHNTTVTLEPSANTSSSYFRDMVIVGKVQDAANFERVQLNSSEIRSGSELLDVGIRGPVLLHGTTGQFKLRSCYGIGSFDPYINPTINCANSNAEIIATDFRGSIRVQDKTGNSLHSYGMLHGFLSVANTCTLGVIVAAGPGQVVDEATPVPQIITTGITNTGLYVNNNTLEERAADRVWDSDLTKHTKTGSFGERMNKLLTKIQSLYFK